MWKRLALLTFVCCFANISSESFLPIVLWHGMGDFCCNPFGMGRIKRELEEALPGVHVKSLMIGDGILEDMANAFLMHPNDQVEIACAAIKSDSALANGYNAIGFSQGSQFLRAVAQRCPEPAMKNLVSLGAQHQGVYGLPRCDVLTSTFCDQLRPVVSGIAYMSFAQELLAQATYWHDPVNEDAYRTKSTFLADINNERHINQTYVGNLQAMENLIFVKFNDDKMVQPLESQWFGFYKSGQSKEVQTLQDSEVYKRLGLEEMDAQGKLHFLSTPGDHLQLDWSWFLENVVNVFFK